MQVEITKQPFVDRCIWWKIRRGIRLEVPVDDDLITVFVCIDPVKDEGWLTVKPDDVPRRTMTWDHAQSHRHLRMKAIRIHLTLEEVGVPEQWAIIDDRKVLGEHHVVWQTRARKRDIDVSDEFSLRRDDAVVHVGVRRRVVEEHQLPSPHVDLGMC